MSAEFPLVTAAICDYRAAADLHDFAVAQLVEQLGEDDAQQAAFLQTALRLIDGARNAIDAALAQLEGAAQPAPHPVPRIPTPHPMRQSGYFPRWRV